MPGAVVTAWQGESVSHASELIASVENDLREIATSAGALRYCDCGPDSGLGSREAPVLLFLHGSGPGVTGWRNFRGVLPPSPHTSVA